LLHSYPHCWRHKTPIIFRATAQWFIGMDKQGKDGVALRERAKSAVDATEFFPAWGRARLEAMIGNRPDWCVSRQRNWGVPMTFFVHKETGELHPRSLALLEEVALRIEQQGIEAWFSLDAGAAG
jgi:isoleucyl-tRNA synthetase